MLQLKNNGEAMFKNIVSLGSVAAAAVVWFSPDSASALLEECGNIDLRGDAECEVLVEGGCEVACDPSSLTLACSGELYVECQGQCEGEIDVDCTGSCTADCYAECEVDPGDFSCEASCEGSCEADCSGKCQASGNRAECEASCEATCQGDCSAACEGTPPSATCEGKCEASCEGQCQAQASLDCQIDCQGDAYLDCKTNMADICEAQCTRPEGAIVCDGQFVNADSVRACAAAIEAALDIEVNVDGSASGECKGNECNAKAKGSVSCAVVPGDASGETFGWSLAALGLAVAACSGRHLRRS